VRALARRRATATPAATTGADATATSEPTEATPAGVAIEVKDGEVVGGEGTIEVKQGETARFSVTSDVADEVHVHGYDVKKDVEAGGTASFEIPAKITGIFEVELENAGIQLASLRVDP
jgi:FtsP/CotA-like multicopper oxidase with cupredoxin domain